MRAIHVLIPARGTHWNSQKLRRERRGKACGLIRNRYRRGSGEALVDRHDCSVLPSVESACVARSGGDRPGDQARH